MFFRLRCIHTPPHQFSLVQGRVLLKRIQINWRLYSRYLGCQHQLYRPSWLFLENKNSISRVHLLSLERAEAIITLTSALNIVCLWRTKTFVIKMGHGLIQLPPSHSELWTPIIDVAFGHRWHQTSEDCLWFRPVTLHLEHCVVLPLHRVQHAVPPARKSHALHDWYQKITPDLYLHFLRGYRHVQVFRNRENTGSKSAKSCMERLAQRKNPGHEDFINDE